MKKIIFQDIDGLISALSELQRVRGILGSEQVPQVIWRGPEGIYTQLRAILNFYEKYLREGDAFKAIVDRIKEAVQRIPQRDFEKLFFSANDNREAIFEILNIAEEFQQKIVQHYALNTLFQFTNITFNSDILFSRIEEVFQIDSWAFIPDAAKLDITEGARALLFNLPTCASFMFLRALEDCLRKICSSLSPSEKQLMFGAAIDLISKERAKFSIEEKTFDRQISFLRYIKDEYRNPSAHPDKSFSQKEAEQLFQVINVAVDKLSYLYDHMAQCASASSGRSSGDSLPNSLDESGEMG